MKQPDNELATVINAYMAAHKYATMGEVRVQCKTSPERIKKLADGGLIKIPHKLSRKIAGTLSRAKNKTSRNFYITKPAPWMTKSN